MLGKVQASVLITLQTLGVIVRDTSSPKAVSCTPVEKGRQTIRKL